MIRIATAAGGVDSRIASDPRLSKSQREALSTAAATDTGAAVVGLDSKMRPVVRAHLDGPGEAVEYALLRNGEPTRVTRPLAETWRQRDGKEAT